MLSGSAGPGFPGLLSALGAAFFRPGDSEPAAAPSAASSALESPLAAVVPVSDAGRWTFLTAWLSLSERFVNMPARKNGKSRNSSPVSVLVMGARTAARFPAWGDVVVERVRAAIDYWTLV
jgi:hypothetical protein